MRYIKDKLENTIEIKKSKFITHIYRVDDLDEINIILSDIKKRYYDASHNCYAYILGDNMEIQKASDDGEPQKTAGFPMLEALKKYDVTNILAITTRYFGGTLLGASGLIHAYSESVHEALKNALYYKKEFLKEYLINTDYKGYNQLIKMEYVNILDQNFLDNVILRCGIKLTDYDRFKKDLISYKLDLDIKEIGNLQIEIPE